MRHSVLRSFFDLALALVIPARCEFGGGGGGTSRPVPPPAPPPPPAATQAVTSARTLLAKMQPKRNRASTILAGDDRPLSNELGKRSILGSPLTR